MVALALTGCSDSLSTIDSSEGKADITISSDAEAGELLIKFAPEMSSILDQAQLSKTCSGKATRSGIPSTDEVLDILGSYSFERVHPEINSGNHFHANNFMPGFGIARPSRRMNGI